MSLSLTKSPESLTSSSNGNNHHLLQQSNHSRYSTNQRYNGQDFDREHRQLNGSSSNKPLPPSPTGKSKTLVPEKYGQRLRRVASDQSCARSNDIYSMSRIRSYEYPELYKNSNNNSSNDSHNHHNHIHFSSSPEDATTVHPIHKYDDTNAAINSNADATKSHPQTNSLSSKLRKRKSSFGFLRRSNKDIDSSTSTSRSSSPPPLPSSMASSSNSSNFQSNTTSTLATSTSTANSTSTYAPSSSLSSSTSPTTSFGFLPTLPSLESNLSNLDLNFPQTTSQIPSTPKVSVTSPVSPNDSPPPSTTTTTETASETLKGNHNHNTVSTSNDNLDEFSNRYNSNNNSNSNLNNLGFENQHGNIYRNSNHHNPSSLSSPSSTSLEDTSLSVQHSSSQNSGTSSPNSLGDKHASIVPSLPDSTSSPGSYLPIPSSTSSPNDFVSSPPVYASPVEEVTGFDLGNNSNNNDKTSSDFGPHNETSLSPSSSSTRNSQARPRSRLRSLTAATSWRASSFFTPSSASSLSVDSINGSTSYSNNLYSSSTSTRSLGPRPRANTQSTVPTNASVATSIQNSSNSPSLSPRSSTEPSTQLKSGVSLKEVPPNDDETPEQYVTRLTDIVPRSELARLLATSSEPFYAKALDVCLEKFDFTSDPIDVALRKMLMHLLLPSETQQIDRLLVSFANRYYKLNSNLFPSTDQPYILAFSLIMLHTDAFNRSNKHKMTKADYVKNTTIEGVPQEILHCLYDNTVFSPFIFVEDDGSDLGNSPSLNMSTFSSSSYRQASTDSSRNPSLSTRSALGTPPMSSSSSGFTSPQRTSSSLFSSLSSSGREKTKVDPYFLIANKLTQELRAEVDLHVPKKNPFSFTGTTPFFNATQLHKQCLEAPLLPVHQQGRKGSTDVIFSPIVSTDPQIPFIPSSSSSSPTSSPKNTPHRQATAPVSSHSNHGNPATLKKSSSSNTVSKLHNPKSHLPQHVIASSTTGEKPPPPSSSSSSNTKFAHLRICKAGVMTKKEDLIEGGKKSSSRKWRDVSVILTPSQLLFYRDPSFADKLKLQIDRLRKNNEKSSNVLLAPADHMRPEFAVSLVNTVAIWDWTYTRRPHTFTLAISTGREYLLQARNEQEMNSWIATINWVAAFKACGFKMRLSPTILAQNTKAAKGQHGRTISKSSITDSASVNNSIHDKPSSGVSQSIQANSQDENQSRQHRVNNLLSEPDKPLTGSTSSQLQQGWDDDYVFTPSSPTRIVDSDASSTTSSSHPPTKSENENDQQQVSKEKDDTDDTTQDNVQNTQSKPQQQQKPLKIDTNVKRKVSVQRQPQKPTSEARAAMMRKKISELDSSISKQKEQLHDQIRLAQNLAVLTPFQTSTRQRIQSTVSPVASRVRRMRKDLCKNFLFREVLARDLLNEDREKRQLTMNRRKTGAAATNDLLARNHSMRNGAPTERDDDSHTLTSANRLSSAPQVLVNEKEIDENTLFSNKSVTTPGNKVGLHQGELNDDGGISDDNEDGVYAGDLSVGRLVHSRSMDNLLSLTADHSSSTESNHENTQGYDDVGDDGGNSNKDGSTTTAKPVNRKRSQTDADVKKPTSSYPSFLPDSDADNQDDQGADSDFEIDTDEVANRKGQDDDGEADDDDNGFDTTATNTPAAQSPARPRSPPLPTVSTPTPKLTRSELSADSVLANDEQGSKIYLPGRREHKYSANVANLTIRTTKDEKNNNLASPPNSGNNLIKMSTSASSPGSSSTSNMSMHTAQETPLQASFPSSPSADSKLTKENHSSNLAFYNNSNDKQNGQDDDLHANGKNEEAEEEAEDWRRTKAAKRVSLVNTNMEHLANERGTANVEQELRQTKDTSDGFISTKSINPELANTSSSNETTSSIFSLTQSASSNSSSSSTFARIRDAFSQNGQQKYH